MRIGSGRQGVLWSEVKGERRAQPDSEDMSATERPATPSPHTTKNAKGCSGPIAEDRRDAQTRFAHGSQTVAVRDTRCELRDHASARIGGAD